MQLTSAKISYDGSLTNQGIVLPDFDRIQSNEYLTSLDFEDIPNFLVVNCQNLHFVVDPETEIYSSVIVFLTKRLDAKPGSFIKATVSARAVEIKKQEFICGIMGSSHVGFGFFGSNVYYLNCIDDFFEKYYVLVEKKFNPRITVGEPPFFYRTNQYNNHLIFSEMGGVVFAKARESNTLSGIIDASGIEGGITNDIMFGTTAGGTVYIESPSIDVSGRHFTPYNPRHHQS